MAFSLFKILEPFWLFNFHLFQPQASPNPYPRVAGSLPSPSHCPRVSSAPSQLLLKFWGRLLPGPGFGLAAAGSWRRGQVEVELRQATGGLGHADWAGKKKSKKVNWKSQKKSNKSQKKSNVRILALADYWRQQKVKKSHKKVEKKSKKVKSGKSQKSRKNVKKKSKKSQKKVTKKVKKKGQM